MSLSASTARRLAASTLVGGLAAVVPQLVAPAANATTECYSAPTIADTALTISPAAPAVGRPFTATATVSSAGTPVTGGTVIFSYAGTSSSGAVSGGVATARFTTQSGQSDVSASYVGECLAGAAAAGFTSPVVGGVQESAPVPRAGGLAPTGLDSDTEVIGLLGAGLVAVGGVTLLVRRRRANA